MSKKEIFSFTFHFQMSTTLHRHIVISVMRIQHLTMNTTSNVNQVNQIMSRYPKFGSSSYLKLGVTQTKDQVLK